MSTSDNLPIDTPVDETPIVPRDIPENPPIEKDNDAVDIDSIVNEIVAEEYPGFDPSVHAVDADGKPKMRGNGSFALKRGRKPGVPRETSGSVPRETKPKPQRTEKTSGAFHGSQAEQITNLEAARQFCNLGITAAVIAIGPEWAPRDKSEADGLSLAVKNYFDAKGQIQLSPEWGLALAVFAYSMPRLQVENTRSKLSTAREWVRDRYYWLRGKFGAKKFVEKKSGD